MTYFWRRKRLAAQRVATAPVAFDDRRDFIADDFSDPGADHSYPLTQSVAGGPSVHRSPREPDPLLASLLTLTFRDVYPALDLALRRRRVAWGAQRRQVPVRSRLPVVHSLARLEASRRELNRLQLDPRSRVCVRRAARREVLFARGRAGRGGMRPPRRTIHSSWSC